MVVTVLAQIIGAALSIYMLLCVLRICMTWMPGFSLGKPGQLIRSIVDPYLALFARIKMLRAGNFDVSPIVALAVLSVLNRMFNALAYAGRITIGFILSLFVGLVWSALGFVIGFLTVCAFVRILVYLAKLNSLHPLWRAVDALLNPSLLAINRLVYRGRAVDYLQGLLTGFAVLALLWIGGGVLVRILSAMLLALPI